MNCNIQERTLHLVLRLRGETVQHQWQRDHRDPEHLPHKAHKQWHVSAQFSSLVLSSSHLIAHHIAWLKFILCASLVPIHDVCFSSTLSPPFSSSSSSHHSSSTSCTSSCTSSTTLRAVETLRTSLERRWTPLTIATSSHKQRRIAHHRRVFPRSRVGQIKQACKANAAYLFSRTHLAYSRTCVQLVYLKWRTLFEF